MLFRLLTLTAASCVCRHPHIVNLYAVIETAENVYIVMELVEVLDTSDFTRVLTL